MNKKYFISFILLALFSGCVDLTEDPKSRLTPITYFKTQSDLDASVAAMYLNLAKDGSWGFTSKETSYFGSDDYTTDPGLNKYDQRDFDRLSGGSSNQSMRAEWEGPWQAIYQANNIITNYLMPGLHGQQFHKYTNPLSAIFKRPKDFLGHPWSRERQTPMQQVPSWPMFT